MIEIVTGSRLHFGLFQPGDAAPGERQFGGVGMMIAQPGLRLRAEPAEEWSAEGGPWSARIAAVMQECRRGWDGCPHSFTVASAAPEHAGLGTGTQFSLAIAKLLAVSTGSNTDIDTLAARSGRGRRSGIGTHGFVHGGLLVDGGRGTSGGIAPLLARMAVPGAWRIVLAIPSGGGDWHGRREQRAFDQLGFPDEKLTASLCRLTLLGLLPALAERDLDRFGEALYELNLKAGTLFAGAQGGSYVSAEVAAVVAFLRGLGVRGVGQSSWGPTVFALVGDEERAAFVAGRLRQVMSLMEDEVIISAPLNEGARAVDLVTGERY